MWKDFLLLIMTSVFYGAKLVEGQLVIPRLSESAGLRITRVTLNPEKAGSKRTSLLMKINETTFHIASLEKDKVEDKTLDLYFANNEVVQFEVKGKGELHLLGYLEPVNFSSDDDDG